MYSSYVWSDVEVSASTAAMIPGERPASGRSSACISVSSIYVVQDSDGLLLLTGDAQHDAKEVEHVRLRRGRRIALSSVRAARERDGTLKGADLHPTTHDPSQRRAQRPALLRGSSQTRG
jgi:hypothetical protein